MRRSILVCVAGVALSCGGSSSFPDADTTDAPITAGTIGVSWTLTDTDQNTIACADVAAGSVSLTATPTVGGFGSVDPFTCSTGSGISRTFMAGTYNVVMGVGSVSGTLAPTQAFNSVEVIAGQNTDLGAITFEIPTQGGFTFTLDTPASGNNCDPESSDGGGITDLEFELHDKVDVCLQTSFAIDGAGTYNNDCGGASVGACIEKGTTITVTGAPSGTHRLVLKGFKGALECYERTSQLIIPGNDLSLDLDSLLLLLDATPQCDPAAPDAGPTPDAGIADAMAPDA